MIHPNYLSKRLILSCFWVLTLASGPFLIFVTEAQNVDRLEPGNPIERELKSSEKHTYSIILKANDYLKLVVEQKGIDVVVRLLGPDGKKLAEVDSPNGTQGPEPLNFIVEQPGQYTLEVESLEKTASPGRYEVKVEAILTATEAERAEVEIAKLNAEVGRLRQAGKYDQGLVLAQQALEKAEKTIGPNHPETVSSLNNLAVLYQDQGDYPRAEPLYQRALAIDEKALGPDHPLVATSLNNLALLYKAKGDYPRAEPLYQRALAIYEKALGPDHPLVATSLNNLASLYQDKGDYAQAEPLYQRTLAIDEKALGPDHPEVATDLNSLAGLYYSKGDYPRAEPLYQRALAIREKALGADHPSVATSLNNLALFYRAKGDSLRAEPLFLRDLAISEKALGPDHPSVATSLNNLAGLYYKDKGDYQRAEPLYQRALAIREKALGPDHPMVATSLHHLASLYQAKGNVREALILQSRGNEVRERDLLRNLVSGSERQKTLYLKTSASDTDRTLSLHLQGAPQEPKAMQDALTIVLRRKGRALDAMTNAIGTLRSQSDSKTQKLLDDYASLCGQTSALTLRGPGIKKPADYLAYLGEIEKQKEQLEADLSHRSGEFKARIIPITLENVQEQIPARAILVEFASYSPFDVKTQTSGVARFAVYTLNPEGEIKWADLGEAAPIERAVTAFRKVLSQPKTNFTKDITPAAQALDRLVMKPVRALVGNANHLLISPDGALNLIPFSALVDDRGKFLIERYTLTYLTSGRDLLRLAVKIDSQQPPLVMADPNYLDGDGPHLMSRLLGRLGRLVGTRLEGEQLKNIFPDARLKMRAEATEQAIKQVTRPVLVHIATHGYFLEDAPKPEQEPPAGQAGRNLETPPINVEQERQANPLLRSMLFFAGANQGGSDDNDGVMTALEAAQLNLWGTKLVTLSACDTGLGDVKNGDGVYGLRRALVLAGSESQMMSLWPVSDQATRELMIDYYTRLKAGEGRSQALRNVQLKMLKNPRRQHPFYWASFIQSGEWANLAGKR